MNLISCEKCGVVFDKDILEYNNEFNIYVSCPVCKGNIKI